MKKYYVLTAILAVVLSACSSAPSVNKMEAKYNPETEARMRLYRQNGAPSIATYQHNGKKVEINVGGSMGDAFSSLVGAKSSESIGMPETQVSKSLGERNGIASRAFFREVVVPANTKIDVTVTVLPLVHTNNNPGGLSFSTKGCSRQLSFISKPNTDYDIASNGCNGIVYEIDFAEGTNNTILKPVN
ncbi:hypothetical protein [Wohlfahrtiimonas populi]|uniref:hypothetical protein n=1 Tax=Wohlfahrtiimonas populi TaxID=1940240 RepID=UPI00117EA9FE|nr:hypothetical protein [Wohlfahrtiimonas populi]